MRTELKIGLGITALFLTLNALTPAPEWLLGGLFGGGSCFMIIGLLPAAAYARLKQFKENLFSRGAQRGAK